MKKTTVPREPRAGDRILMWAGILFAKFGYNGVSTREIASAAQVNEVTIYRHHARKLELYLAAVQEGLRQVRLSDDLLAQIAEAPSGREALVRTLLLIVEALNEKDEIIRLFQYSVLEVSDESGPLLREHLLELVEVIADYLNPWIEKGELRSNDSRAVVLTLISVVISYGALQRLFNGKLAPLQNMFETCADMYVPQNVSPDGFTENSAALR